MHNNYCAAVCWPMKGGRTQVCGIYTVSQKKRHPFYFCDIFVKFHPILLIFLQKHAPGNLKQTHVHAQFTSRSICLYCTL